MSTRVVDRVENWNERSFTEGYQTLADLADEEFSGVIRTNGTALFMTKGVPIEVQDGTLTDFEGAAGTAYESPSPALPVLAVMQADNEGVRDELYSEQTSLAEVDSKLSDGGFTGYIELSENVLSGDYYVVYHGGRSMSVGFVGESARLIDGDEAFETANDEVGIYQIRPAEITPLDLPEPKETAVEPEDTPESDTATETPPSDDSPVDDTDAESEKADSPASGEETSVDDQPTDEGGSSPVAEPEQEDTSVPTGAGTDAESSNTARSVEQSGSPRQTQQQSSQGTTNRTGQSQPTESAPQSGTAQQAPPHDTGSYQPPTQRGAENQPQSSHRQGPTPSRTQQSPARTPQGGTQSMETHAIPSLDPTRTQEKQAGPAVTHQTAGTAQQPTGQHSTQPNHQPAQANPTQQGAAPQPPQQGQSGSQHTDPAPANPSEAGGENAAESASDDAAESETAAEQTGHEAELEALESAKAELDERVDQLETERDELETENEELTAELEAVRTERDELAAEVDQLQSELTRLETELGAATGAEQRITPQEALLGTDIFIRYQSKGEATLDTAHDGEASREELNRNLRLEKHTQFEAESASVGGQTYAEFLDGTVEYQFVEWLVRELLFEIRDTGHAKALKDLYNVLPNVDRAELGGVVEIQTMEDGEQITLEESFDVVLRDRMGEPLLVANLNDSREAATAGMMERLITSAERVGESVDTFAGAFLVTRSFFERGALEIAGEATQSGFLNREKRKSFVNLSRKTGYHLCLVEARNDNFHMAVPEL